MGNDSSLLWPYGRALREQRPMSVMPISQFSSSQEGLGPAYRLGSSQDPPTMNPYLTKEESPSRADGQFPRVVQFLCVNNSIMRFKSRECLSMTSCLASFPIHNWQGLAQGGSHTYQELLDPSAEQFREQCSRWPVR